MAWDKPSLNMWDQWDDALFVNETLSIALIGDHVGSFLSVKDLRSCRLVCRHWCNWSSAPLRKKELIVLRRVGDLEKLIRYPDPAYGLRPYRRFLINLPMFIGKALDRLINDFWITHGSCLTYVQLKNVQNISVDVFLDIFCRRTPSLKTMIMQDVLKSPAGYDILDRVANSSVTIATSITHLELERATVGMPILPKVGFYKFMLGLCPKLTKLIIKGEFEYSHFFHLDDIFKSLILLKNDEAKNYIIKELHMIDCFRNPNNLACIPGYFVETLKKLNFPLEILTIDIGIGTERAVMSNLLELYKGTLIKLDIIQSTEMLPFPDFPFNMALEKLTVFRMGDGLTKNMEFLKCMPNLEILHVCAILGRNNFFSSKVPNADVRFVTDILERTNLAPMVGFKLESLKEIRFDYDISHGEIVGKIGKWCPNVEILTTAAVLNLDSALPGILQAWKKLKELRLRIGRRSREKTLAKYPSLKGIKDVVLYSKSKLLVSNVESAIQHEIPDNHKLPPVENIR